MIKRLVTISTCYETDVLYGAFINNTTSPTNYIATMTFLLTPAN